MASSAAAARTMAELVATLYSRGRYRYSVDLTHLSVRVLQFIAMAAGPPRVEEVRAYLGSALTTASELLKRLEGKGYVTRTRSKTDERVVHVELTPAGRKVLVEQTMLDWKLLAQALSVLSGDERATLISLMQRVTDSMGKGPPTRPSAP